MSRREKRRRNDAATSQRARLLEAAVSLFTVAPYGAVTTRAIADRAGVTPALIRYYFGNKAGLYKAALTSLHKTKFGRLKRLVRRRDAPNLEVVVDALFEALRETPEFPLEMFKVIVLEDESPERGLLMDALRDAERTLRDILSKMQKNGQIDTTQDLALIEVTVMSLWLTPFLLRPFWLRHFGEEHADEFIQMVLHRHAALLEHALGRQR